MIEEPPLLTIKRPSRRPTVDQIAAFQSLPSSIVLDAMEGAGALDMEVRHLAPGQLPPHVAGPALTADNGPGDVLALFAALEFIQEGDVIVSAYDGFQRSAGLGDRVASMIKNAGAAGAVLDAPARDIAGILPVGLGVWCTGITPASPVSSGPGKVGMPVQIGGRQVETGDMIVADLDGVVVVPFDQIDAVAKRAAEILELEGALDQKVKDGQIGFDRVKTLLNSDRVRWVE